MRRLAMQGQQDLDSPLSTGLYVQLRGLADYDSGRLSVVPNGDERVASNYLLQHARRNATRRLSLPSHAAAATPQTAAAMPPFMSGLPRP